VNASAGPCCEEWGLNVLTPSQLGLQQKREIYIKQTDMLEYYAIMLGNAEFQCQVHIMSDTRKLQIK
jgi:hypothetical protein